MKKRGMALLLSALLLAGCAQGPDSSSASSSQPDVSRPEPDAASGVRVDWSRLEGGRETPPDVDGGRWYPEYTDRLIPGPDYGLLVPYVGGQAYSFNRWEVEIEGKWETQEYFSDWPTSFYGLMTREGKIVVDPVYQNAFPYSCCRDGEDRELPVLLLARADEAWKDCNSGLRYAVAAEDGSWITDFAFINYTSREDRLFLLRPEGCTVLDSRTGDRRDWSWAELGIGEEEVSDTLEFIQWGIGLNWLDQGVCLGQRDDQAAVLEDMTLRIFNPDTGEVSWAGYRQWDQWQSEYYDWRWGGPEEMYHENGGMVLEIDGRSYFLKDTYETGQLSVRRGDFAVLDEQHAGDSCESLYRLSTGERLLEGEYIDLLQDLAHPELVLPVCRDQGVWTVYSDALEPLLTLPRTSEDVWVYHSLRDGLLSVHSEAGFFGCYDLEAGRYVFYRNLGLGD